MVTNPNGSIQIDAENNKCTLNTLKKLKNLNFLSLTKEEILKIKTDQQRPDLTELTIVRKTGRVDKFNNSYYYKYTWLAGCPVEKKKFVLLVF